MLTSLLFPLAILLILVGLVLCIRRQIAGFALVGAVALAYAGWGLYQGGGALSPAQGLLLGLLVTITALGLALEAISERLHLRLGWISQDTVWGGFIGGMIAMFLFGGAFWMLLGTLVGTVAMQLTRRRGTVSRALVDGVEGFYAMFGAAGLRVLFAVVLADLFLSLARTPLRGLF